MNDALPPRPTRHLGPVLVDGHPVELAAIRVNVHLVRAQPAAPLPKVADDPEEEDDGEGEVQLEEALGGVEARLPDGGGDGGVKLPDGQ